MKLLPPTLATALLLALVYLQVCCPAVFAAPRHLLFDLYLALPVTARPGAAENRSPSTQAPGVPETDTNVAITVVEIDEDSLSRHGAWPWSASTLAALMARLAGARTIGLTTIPSDVATCGDSGSPGGPPGAGDEPWSTVTTARRRTGGDPVAAPPLVVGFALLERGGSPLPPPRRAGLVTHGDGAVALPTRLPTSLLPAATTSAGAAGIGALNVFPDRDGRLRRLPLLVQIGDALYPSLTAELLRLHTGAGSFVVRADTDPGATAPLSLRLGERVIPLNASAEVWLQSAPHRTFASLSAANVLAGESPSGLIDGRLVLIGVTAPGIGARISSAFGERLSPAALQAQALTQLLAGRYPQRPPWAGLAEALVTLGGGLGLILFSLRWHGSWLIGAGLVLTLGLLAGGLLLFRQGLWLFDTLSPALIITAIFTLLALGGYLLAERERRWITRAFASYVSPNLVAHLLRHPADLRIRGERRECSFLMTDLADFTSLVEQFAPERLVALLNRYLDEIIAIVFRHDGTLERIVGDAVSVHFSAPVRQPNHARRALDCALAIDRFASAFADSMRSRGVPFGDTRIGVHTGEVIIGNFGGRHQLNYRAFGDPINTTARLESANRFFGTRITVSAVTAACCPEHPMRPIGDLLLKGKSQPVGTCTPLSVAQIDSGLATAYHEAYRLLGNGDPGAQAAFAAVAARFPDDQLTRWHLARLARGEHGTAIRLGQ